MDKERIARFANVVYRDMAGAMSIGMGYLGLRTRLFAALAESGPVTPAALAAATDLYPRDVDEWLKGMTAAGWLEHDEAIWLRGQDLDFVCRLRCIGSLRHLSLLGLIRNIT